MSKKLTVLSFNTVAIVAAWTTLALVAAALAANGLAAAVLLSAAARFACQQVAVQCHNVVSVLTKDDQNTIKHMQLQNCALSCTCRHECFIHMTAAETECMSYKAAVGHNNSCYNAFLTMTVTR